MSLHVKEYLVPYSVLFAAKAASISKKYSQARNSHQLLTQVTQNMTPDSYIRRMLFCSSIFIFLSISPLKAQVYFSVQGGIITQFQEQGISPYTEINIGGGFGESILDWSIYGSYWQSDARLATDSDTKDHGTSAGGRLAVHLSGFNSQFRFFTGLSQQFIKFNQQDITVGTFDTGFTADFRLIGSLWFRLNLKQNLLLGTTQFASENRWSQRSISGGLALNF